MSLVNNLKSLEEQLLLNAKFLKLLKNRQMISLSDYSYQEQVEVLDYMMDQGKVEVEVRVPSKVTDNALAHFYLVKGVFYLSLGHIDLPSLRKSTKRESGLAYLFRTSFQSILQADSEALKVENKTLLAYVLMREEQISSFEVLNATFNKKPTDPLPEKYNSWEKIKELIPVEEWAQRLKV